MWAASSEKKSLNMREMCGFTSSCKCAKSHLGICSLLKHSLVSNDSFCGQRRTWSDCADAQSDLGLRCPHMPKDMFSHGADHVMLAKPRENVHLNYTWTVGLSCGFLRVLRVSSPPNANIRAYENMFTSSRCFLCNLDKQKKKIFQIGLYWILYQEGKTLTKEAGLPAIL